MLDKFALIFLYCLTNLQARVIPAHNTQENNSTQHVVEETQHATCSISSDDLAATANATITRQLKGICTSAHLDNRLNILENIIIRELNDIKDILLEPEEDNPNFDTNKNIQFKSNIPTSNLVTPSKFHYNEENKTKNNFQREQKHYLISYTNNNKVDNVINDEIKKNNMTILKDDAGIIFQYYWKIQNILDVMSSQNAIESGDFQLSGYHIFIRLFPRLSYSKKMLIQVIGIGEFKLAHQFSILSQANMEHDVFSPIIINCEEKINKIQVQCDGFEVTQDTLLSKNLIKNEIMIIKLMIYL